MATTPAEKRPYRVNWGLHMADKSYAEGDTVMLTEQEHKDLNGSAVVTRMLTDADKKKRAEQEAAEAAAAAAAAKKAAEEEAAAKKP